jgi:thymidylate synthase
MQRIIVFQQRGSGEYKTKALAEYDRELRIVEVVSIDEDLPELIDQPGRFLPAKLDADLVIDHLQHPDLSDELSRICLAQSIPLIASGRKTVPGCVFAPPTCCGLARHPELGAYAERFGAPELSATAKDGKIASIEVIRGAPCGATSRAAERVIGLALDEGVTRYGLEAQFFCKADPSRWDPIHGKSPVHFAGKVHARALAVALEQGQD